MNNIVGLTLVEKVLYSSEIPNELKDELLTALSNQVDKEALLGEVQESIVSVTGLFTDVKKILSTNKKDLRADLEYKVKEAYSEIDEIESSLDNTIEYHLEKIKSIRELI